MDRAHGPPRGAPGPPPGRLAPMSADELVYRRVFRAPRELVWRCLTEPAELAQFWGPRGMTTPLDGIVVELRAGGRFETADGRRASAPTGWSPRSPRSSRPSGSPGSSRPPGCTRPAPSRPRRRRHRGRHPPAARARADALARGPRRLPAPRSTSSRSTSPAAHPRRTDRDRDSRPGWRRPTTAWPTCSPTAPDDGVGRAVAVRGVAGAARRRPRDDAGAAHARAVRRRDGGGRRRLRRAVQHRGRTRRGRCRSPSTWPSSARRGCTRGSRRAAARRGRSATPSSTPSTSPSRSTGPRSRRPRPWSPCSISSPPPTARSSGST